VTHLAFLGTGLIGSGLAEAAARRGERVVAWNRSLDKARALESFGVRTAATAAEAIAGAARIHLALTDDAAVDAVLSACGRALEEGAVVVDHTTASPAGTKARAEELERRGVPFLHAPVFMSPKMCREAGGLMLASGPKAVFERAAPGLKPMTGTLEYLGERRDLAAAYKLFGNAMILTIVGGLADVYAMAAALDIPAGDAHSLFSKFNPATTIAVRGALMAKGDYRPSFEMSMARKDLRLMLETAEAGGRHLGVLPALAERMDQLIKDGYGRDDLGVLAVESVPKC
jgi:3-hydroxyisobutyrate dehydrogenase